MKEKILGSLPLAAWSLQLAARGLPLAAWSLKLVALRENKNQGTGYPGPHLQSRLYHGVDTRSWSLALSCRRCLHSYNISYRILHVKFFRLSLAACLGACRLLLEACRLALWTKRSEFSLWSALASTVKLLDTNFLVLAICYILNFRIPATSTAATVAQI